MNTTFGGKTAVAESLSRLSVGPSSAFDEQLHSLISVFINSGSVTTEDQLLTQLSHLLEHACPLIKEYKPDNSRLNNCRDGLFISWGLLSRTRATIAAVRSHIKWTLGLNFEIVDLLLEAPKLLLVLVIMDNPSLIKSFLGAGLNDSSLPLSATQALFTLHDHHLAAVFLAEQHRIWPRQVHPGEHIMFEDLEPLPIRSIRPLGRGGFGTVDEVHLLPEHISLARKSWRGCSNPAKTHFARETAVLRTLPPHLHIVRFEMSYIRGQEGGILMHPVAQGDLWDLLTSPRRTTLLSDSCLWKSFGCLSAALLHMHRLGIRHKDVKPQNILIHDGSFLFTDFGLSSDITRLSSSITRGRPAFRTVKYCAPEVADWDERGRLADVFSLGCVLMEVYSVLIGCFPFDQTSFSSLSPFHQNLDLVEEWIKRHLDSAKRPEAIAWLRLCHGMLQPKEERLSIKEVFQLLQASAESEHLLTTLSCGACNGKLGDQLPNDLHYPEISWSSSRTLHTSMMAKLDEQETRREFGNISRKLLQGIGILPDDPILPDSFNLALQNRFSSSNIRRLQMSPESVWKANPRFSAATAEEIAQKMTPAIIHGFKEYAVSDTDWPVLIFTDNTEDEIPGMVLFNVDDHKSIRLNDVSQFERITTKAQIELVDGSTLEMNVCTFTWAGFMEELVPLPEKEWSVQDILGAGWMISSDGQVEGTQSQQGNTIHSSSSTEDNSSNPPVSVLNFRCVSIDDPCHKVLPVALRKYNIQADWQQYSLYICYGAVERCLGLNERPLILFKELDRKGLKPMFMLRKHPAPEEGYMLPDGSTCSTL